MEGLLFDWLGAEWGGSWIRLELYLWPMSDYGQHLKEKITEKLGDFKAVFINVSDNINVRSRENKIFFVFVMIAPKQNFSSTLP